MARVKNGMYLVVRNPFLSFNPEDECWGSRGRMEIWLGFDLYFKSRASSTEVAWKHSRLAVPLYL